MNPRSLSLVGLRVLAVYLITKSFIDIADVAVNVLRESVGMRHSPYLVLAYAWIFAPLVIGLALWLAAPQVSRWITRDTRAVQAGDIDHAGLMTTAFVITGVVLVSEALPSILFEGVRIWDALQPPQMPYAIHVAYLLSSLARAALGLGLVLGAHGLTRVLHALRYHRSSGQSG